MLSECKENWILKFYLKLLPNFFLKDNKLKLNSFWIWVQLNITSHTSLSLQVKQCSTSPCSTAVHLFVALFHAWGQIYDPLFFSHHCRANTETNLLYYTSKKWTWAMAGPAIFPGALKGCTTFLYWYLHTISPIIHWREAGEGVTTTETRGEKRAMVGMGLNRREKETAWCPL